MPRRNQHAYYMNDTVRTIPGLSTTRAFMVPKTNVVQRKADAPGLIVNQLGQSTYLVLHDGETIPAVYEEQELRYEPNAYWSVQYLKSGVPYFKEFCTYQEVEFHLSEIEDRAATVEGPFYSDKEPTEGPQTSRTLYDLLTDDV